MRLKGGTRTTSDGIDSTAYNTFDNVSVPNDIRDTTEEEDTIEEGDIFDTFERHTDGNSGNSALSSNPGIIYDVVNRTGGADTTPPNDKEKGYFRLPSVMSIANSPFYRFYLDSNGWLRCQTPSEGLL
jgi:hypothetical protein